jgi:ribosomal protein S27AE
MSRGKANRYKDTSNPVLAGIVPCARCGHHKMAHYADRQVCAATAACPCTSFLGPALYS